MTGAAGPALSLIPGGLSLVPPASPAPAVNAPRSAARVVAAAQQWAALIVESGRADALVPVDSEINRLTFVLLDAVNEYEAHAAGMIPREHEQGPAVTT